jgi:hypothetical protein
MITGAIALIDTLGFKGIWRHHPGDEVLAWLREIEAESVREFDQLHQRISTESAIVYKSAKIAFLSDSVVLALEFKPPGDVLPPATRMSALPTPPPQWNADVIAHLAGFISTVQRRALLKAPEFAYRGSIAFGEYAFERTFIVGEAVDEAAIHHEKAQGAFVSLAPSADAIYRQGAAAQMHARMSDLKLPDSEYTYPLIRYTVPLKDGSSVDTFCVSPFGLHGQTVSDAEIGLCRSALARSFRRTPSDKPDVIAKERNTLQFADYVRHQLIVGAEAMSTR